ncbi:hypothetical protein KI387_016594, partial [Taxus chinensis]
HWQVFNDDNQLITFLEKANNFKELHFDGSTSTCRESLTGQAHESEKDTVIQLKGNKIPK